MSDVSFNFLHIRFRISFWFVALITFYAVTFENSLKVILAVVLHESAHVLVIYLLGHTVASVTFRISDISINADIDAMSRMEQLLVAAGGPAANLMACLTSYLAGDKAFVGINLALGLFQLLPCKGSDGGGMLQILFGKKGENVLRVLSLISAFLVLAIAVLLLRHEKGNLSLVMAVLYIIFMACK